MSKDKDTDLNKIHHRDEAYTLDDPAKHRAYYDAWSQTYDDDFLKAEGYAAPSKPVPCLKDFVRDVWIPITILESSPVAKEDEAMRLDVFSPLLVI